MTFSFCRHKPLGTREREDEGTVTRKTGFGPLLPLVALLACSDMSGLDQTEVLPVRINGHSITCTATPPIKKGNVCTTDCAKPDDPFNSEQPVLVSNCSRSGVFHSRVYSADGKRVLWEGVGTTDRRIFVMRQVDSYLVKVAVRSGTLWFTELAVRTDAQGVADHLKSVLTAETLGSK